MTDNNTADHARQWAGIEEKHFGQCIWQHILQSRSVMVESIVIKMDSGQFNNAIVVKHFERAIPRTGSGKPWPKQTATYVYLPVDDSNTWEGLDAALTAFRAKPAK